MDISQGTFKGINAANIGKPEVEEAFLNMFKTNILTIKNLPLMDSEPIDTAKKTELLAQKLKTAQTIKEIEQSSTLKPETTTLLPSKTQELNSKKGYLPEVITSEIHNCRTADDYLSFNGFVAIFSMYKDEFTTGDLQKFSVFLLRGGYQILGQDQLQIDKVKNYFITKELLLTNKGFSKKEYEKLLQEMTGEGNVDILINSDSANTTSLSILQRSIASKIEAQSQNNIPQKSQKSFDFGLSLLKKVDTNIDSKAKNCIIFLLRGANDESPQKFKTYYENQKGMIPDDFWLYYSSDSKKTAFLDTEVLFPQFFKVNYMTFIMMPTVSKKSHQSTINKLEDLLNMNGFAVLTKKKLDIEPNQLAEIFKEYMENAHYFANFLLTEKPVNLIVAGRIGKPVLVDPSNVRGGFYAIDNQKQNEGLFSKILPEHGKFTRVVVVLRPFLVKNGLSEFCTQLFRINGFILIKRTFVAMNQEKIRFMARLENIEPDSEDEYVSIMQEGQCEILLLSNFGSIARAETIVNGPINRFVDDEYDKDDPDYETLKSIQRGSQFLMSGLRNLVSIPKILSMSLQKNDRLAENTEMKRLTQKISSLKHNSKLKELSQTAFNYLAFSSYNDQTTEELSSIFFSDVTVMSNMLVLVKPGCIQYTDQILEIFQQLNYRVLDAKRVKIEASQTQQLLEFLRTSTSHDGTELFEWQDKEFDMLSLVKSAAKREIISLLRHFKLKNPPKVELPLTKDSLYRVLVPCWNDNAISLVNTAVYAESRVFDGISFKTLNSERKVEVLDYILHFTMGDYINYEPEQFKRDPGATFRELKSFTPNHLHLFARSKQHGTYEIRIRNFFKDPEFDMRRSLEEYQLINYYYKQISRYYNQKCPSFYQFRILPQVEGVTPDQIFDVQEYMGDPFIIHTAKEMTSLRKNEVNQALERINSSIEPDRGSIVAFMYGARLAVYVKKLEKIQPPGELVNFGPLKFLDGKITGTWIAKERLANEVDKYFEILDHYCFDFPVPSQEKDEVSEKLELLFSSQTWRRMRTPENLRIMPGLLHSDSLRIFQKADNTKKATIYEKFSTINYSYEKDANLKVEDQVENVDFALCYVRPEYRGRYTLIAMIHFLLEVELKIFNKQLQTINKNETEYNYLLNGLLEGLHKHYDIDPEHETFMNFLKNANANTVDCYLMEKFLVYLDYLDYFMYEVSHYRRERLEKESIFQQELDDIENRLSKMTLSEREQTVRNLKKAAEERKEELSELNRREILSEGKAKIVFDLIKKIDIIHNKEETLVKKGLMDKIPKSRYYINVYKDNIEKNIFNEKYLVNIEKRENVVDTKHANAPFFQNLDPTQAAWLKRPDFWVNGLRPVEEVARKDGTIVDKLQLPNEEKVKKVFRTTIEKSKHFLNLDF